MNNVEFDSSSSSETFVECGFIHPSSSVFNYRKPTNFPAVACYILNVTSRLENEKERKLSWTSFYI